MGEQEYLSIPGELKGSEVLDPHHFYAAYIFDRAIERGHDIETLIEQANKLGYPVRYWLLSEAMGLSVFPDRLIVCVHHPSAADHTGMDLYEMLKGKDITWDELEAAAVDEYCYFGKTVMESIGLCFSDGKRLFPLSIPTDEHPSRGDDTLFIITEEDVRDEAQYHLGRELTNDEFEALREEFKKCLKSMDWTFYLHEAIRQCQETDRIAPDTDETLSGS